MKDTDRQHTHTHHITLCKSGVGTKLNVWTKHNTPKKNNISHTSNYCFLFGFTHFFPVPCILSLFNIQPRCGNAHIPGFSIHSVSLIPWLSRKTCLVLWFLFSVCVASLRFRMVFESDTINMNPSLKTVTHISLPNNAWHTFIDGNRPHKTFPKSRNKFFSSHQYL